MDEKVLKKIIKQLVRESLTEIFAEMKLETIVETVVSKKVPVRPVPPPSAPLKNGKLSIKEVLGVQNPEPVRQSVPQTNSAERRKVILEKMGGNDMWKGIYADTASSDNPILEGDESPADREQVPTSILESMGLMRDYSKHIGQDAKTTSEDEEWRKRREARAKIMNESIKRT